MLNDAKHLKNTHYNNLLMVDVLNLMYLPKVAFIFYFIYVVYYSGKNKKIKDLLYDLHCCVDEFLGNRDSRDDDFIDDDFEETKKTEKKLPIKSQRFEDKYLEEYKNLESVEFTKEQLDGLKNTMVMETTPIGNVIMFYDNQTENFVYYSDLTIPYRYLEVVGRKYVTTFKCKDIFVDMSEELKTAEEKKVKKQETSSVERENSSNNDANSLASTSKKDVFAKFKTYNNNVSKEVVAAPSKNNGATDMKKEKDNVLLKDKANRYRYEGKLANLNFLQEVDKKKIDKRFAMSWSDYKNLV